ncbi:bifunctional 5,10-methylenetetrahydrofolate dehydrogenase/5,10-methenyltetrahydrofolate cyclohydrolase [Candidatus Parcubacteria bacterium]|nr:bifunctional 5,10-methylenetetrahydrofolate dehydrogenase/5,10-methenyltetrahydrofolate cyclohydrolase [Patescibacteria group bacterium]MBU4309890.1 bifunctional 5,10-methylenetetrahydrofolate dehydrogenase/5,10-methenyltetrahydrofolate cyclohydrolase [Patescibacteria group bacterium]MBU4431898.1 bifunctional 5,10-methylenetetrahydrofolate dehydrogenase/5,10-methenyltetrahydrofolate cyclohydrolase [Patescibacteria group bacterium]MBU4578229.1 bifunctional 5,10-methylenetetrahydrofolate dehydr
MSKIINGRVLAEKIKDQIVLDIEALCQASKLVERRPSLAIILVGEREDSKIYVRLKEQEAKKVGIDTHTYKMDASVPEADILQMIEFLNKDEEVDAILVQLPLPDGFDADKIIKAIDPAKDVDGFHPDNLESQKVVSPVFAVVVEMLESIKYDLNGKNVCIVGNSDIFGNNLAKILERLGAKVVVKKADDADLSAATTQADVLITAIGRANFIKKEMIKEDVVVIDIGIEKKMKHVYGDVDFIDVQDKIGFITPVPGGVGPMTIAMLFRNVVELYKRNKK